MGEDIYKEVAGCGGPLQANSEKLIKKIPSLSLLVSLPLLSPTHLVIVIICIAIKGDLRESAIESRPPFQSDGIVGGCHNLMMMLMMTTMIIMIIYNDDDEGVKKPELVKADLVCWAGQASPESIFLIFYFLFGIISFIIC